MHLSAGVIQNFEVFKTRHQEKTPFPPTITYVFLIQPTFFRIKSIIVIISINLYRVCLCVLCECIVNAYFFYYMFTYHEYKQ